ncbi:hypothetical protein ACFL6U_32455 [Planctomycetota bacterium]
MDQAAKYRIQVRGDLDPRWSDRLGGMSISVEHQSGQRAVTTLTGSLRDQAALSGVLNTLHELHLPVISVSCLDGEMDHPQWNSVKPSPSVPDKRIDPSTG